MVREAGGRISDFGGGEFEISSEESLASNGLIHEQMIRVLGLGEKRESGEKE
jgi:myo-inositol-1(or 4)-monophosphatase